MTPTLLDGDIVLIDTAQKDIGQQDRIWALAYGDLGMIKRVRRLPGGTYRLMSDNPAISDIEAADGEMHVVGRVVYIGRRIYSRPRVTYYFEVVSIDRKSTRLNFNH